LLSAQPHPDINTQANFYAAKYELEGHKDNENNADDNDNG